MPPKRLGGPPKWWTTKSHQQFGDDPHPNLSNLPGYVRFFGFNWAISICHLYIYMYTSTYKHGRAYKSPSTSETYLVISWIFDLVAGCSRFIWPYVFGPCSHVSSSHQSMKYIRYLSGPSFLSFGCLHHPRTKIDPEKHGLCWLRWWYPHFGPFYIFFGQNWLSFSPKLIWWFRTVIFHYFCGLLRIVCVFLGLRLYYIYNIIY